MKLSQVFMTENYTTNSTKTQNQQSPAQIAQMNRQIRSLTPGQTLTGEIVGRNGSEVQIKLSEDMVLNARVDQNLNIEVGKNMTFEVKANGSTLTLSPLFTNVATDMNVLKALDMAGLPVNETSVAMTEQLMSAGMSVNRNFLLQIYREINSYPQGQISDVINLHKLGMPVNDANMSQMESYRNLTHQLVGGMETVLGELSGVAQHLLAKGDAAGATNLYQELFALVTGENASAAGVNSTVGANPVQESVVTLLNIAEGNPGTSVDLKGQMNSGVFADIRNFTQGEALELGQNLSQSDSSANAIVQQHPEVGIADAQGKGTQSASIVSDGTVLPVDRTNITSEVRMSLAQDVLRLVDNLLSDEQAEGIKATVQQFAAGQVDANSFFATMNHIVKHVMSTSKEQVILQESLQNLQNLFSKPEFKNLLLSQLKEQWLITPDEVAEPGKVGELYRRLDNQLKNLSQVLESIGQHESAAYKAVTNMSQNVDFLQQMNQMYTYVQLPLKLQQQDANGELYVYANRKNLAENGGNISALLHLDMEHLGPVDVYVTMQSTKVNTKFYVQDDEMLDFLAEHMDLLTERLKKRGYDCSYAMTTREKANEEPTEGGIDALLRQEKGILLSQYSFDVRT